MNFHNIFNFNAVKTETIQAEWLSDKKVALDVLRLDKIHPVISGNKWFKLKYYLKEAVNLNKAIVATFGGAWSNHIVAVAFACKQLSLKSMGIIRGEQTSVLSETLQNARDYGMELHFVTREEYRNKQEIMIKNQDNDLYWIDEGGYGDLGAKGASELLSTIDFSAYSHLISAVGTGTTVAGLILAATAPQKIIGISSMKGNFSLEEGISKLVAKHLAMPSFEIIHNYHFGGYAKHPLPLIEFINDFYLNHHLALDIVYTGKTMYAIKDLTSKDFFESGSKLLMIHSGGLQGNTGVKAKKLLTFLD